jgi:hypothetical protein
MAASLLTFGRWERVTSSCGRQQDGAQARERGGIERGSVFGTIVHVLGMPRVRELGLGWACGLVRLGLALEGKEKAQGGVWGTRVGPR